MATSSTTQREDTKQTARLQSGNASNHEKINLGDTASLKKALDDEVIKTLKDAGCELDHTFADIKIVLGLTACTAGAVAQLWPGKYPSTTLVLIPCIIIFAILSTALTLFQLLVEKDVLICVHTSGCPALAVRSKLPRLDDQYTIEIKPKNKNTLFHKEVKAISNVGHYFDCEGTLVADTIKDDVLKLLQQAKNGANNESGKKSE